MHAVVVAAATAQPAPAEPGLRSSSWRQIVTADLRVVGDARPGELQRIQRELTRFRDVLGQLTGAAMAGPIPTWVVVLRDQQRFQRFQPRDSQGRPRRVGAYFMRRPDANLIVMPASAELGLETVFHEYTHYLMARNVRVPVPRWLNEGLAEFYSTFRGDYRGKVLVGAVPPARARALRELTFVPLRDIVMPRDMESKWRWEKQIGMHYAESWALVHYILVERKNPGPHALRTYLDSFARTGSHDAAFMEAFGTDVDGMDRELRNYVRRVALPAMLFDIQADIKPSGEPVPMLDADVKALLGQLLLDLGVEEEAERELSAAVQQQPSHPAAQIGLARLRLTQAREDEAIDRLRTVAAAAPSDGPAHYYLGVALARGWRHEEALAAFERAAELMPGNPAPWSGVSHAALGIGRDEDAADALQKAFQVEPSPSRYYSHALEALRLGRNDIAASSLARYMESSGTGEDVSVYPLFVQALAAWRAGRSAEAEAALALAEKGDLGDEWTAKVLRFLQGRLDEAQFLRSAAGLGEQTEARTYVGFKLALAGRQEEALAHFRWVAERGSKNYLEHVLARDELNRLRYQKAELRP